jgi:hypothetical protein
MSKTWRIEVGWLTILLTSPAEPGSTEQADASELALEAWQMSDEYSGAA